MNYDKTDIENLDKVINALITVSISTVPEILYGHEEFPAFNSSEDLDCRTYEDILIDNGICSVTDGWTPNNIPYGYKLICLDRGGRQIVSSKISVRDFLEQKEKEKQQREAQRYSTIHVSGGNAIIGSNNSSVLQAQDGALINTGNEVRIDSHIEVNRGNFETLAQKLSENHVSQQDIAELKSILESDNPNKEKRIFGDKTNGCISKMIAKSLEGTWQIGVGAAGGLLVEVIKNFTAGNNASRGLALATGGTSRR